MWNQNLTPATADFNGRSVTEQDAGGGSDSCHFVGSAFAPFDAITGGTWPVGASNAWGADNVGWFVPAVTYYRTQGRAPCGAVLPQNMVIDCPSGAPFYTFNNLTADIGVTTVSSSRDGQSASRPFP